MVLNKKTKTRVPSIYLDTSIIRELIEKKPADLLNLMTTIKDREWKCFTSTLGILELSELKKDDVYLRTQIKEKSEYKEIVRNRDKKNLSSQELRSVREYIMSFFKKHPKFYFYHLEKSVWKDALTISLHSNISFIDAIHLAASIAFRANLLITIDTQFIKQANQFLQKNKRTIRVVLPKDVFRNLKDLHFKLE